LFNFLTSNLQGVPHSYRHRVWCRDKKSRGFLIYNDRRIEVALVLIVGGKRDWAKRCY
jgi:hypothetical protein